MAERTFGTFTINLPVSKDALGRWMEENGARVEFSCSLGRYDATVTRNRVISYSDEGGEHRETRSVTRFNADLATAIGAALLAAGFDPENKS